MFDICAIGNALVDVIVSTDDAFLRDNTIVKGAMILVDDETASALYARAGGSAAALSSGGSAANSVVGAASLGSRCAFLGKVGRDSFGEAFTQDMRAHDVHFTTPPADGLSTGRCLIFVTPDAQRSMNTFLGAAVDLVPEDIDDALVKKSKVTYLEGYLFDKPLAQQAFIKAARIAHEAGQKTALTLSDVFCVSRHREAFLDLIGNNIDILFANENEAKALYQTENFKTALESARAHTEIAVITRSAEGAVIVTKEKTFEIPAHPVSAVIDTTGAGDLFAAGFLYGLTQNLPFEECGRIGAIAAGEVISHYGPRPQKNLRTLI